MCIINVVTSRTNSAILHEPDWHNTGYLTCPPGSAQRVLGSRKIRILHISATDVAIINHIEHVDYRIAGLA